MSPDLLNVCHKKVMLENSPPLSIAPGCWTALNTACQTLVNRKGESSQRYFDKDIIEKSFQSLKSTLSIQPVRHWLTGRVRAHIFICYLAYLHLTWMGMLLKTHGITMSPIKALESLETIYTVRLTDEKAHASTTKIVPLTKEQEEIYKALNLLSWKQGEVQVIQVKLSLY